MFASFASAKLVNYCITFEKYEGETGQQQYKKQWLGEQIKICSAFDISISNILRLVHMKKLTFAALGFVVFLIIYLSLSGHLRLESTASKIDNMFEFINSGDIFLQVSTYSMFCLQLQVILYAHYLAVFWLSDMKNTANS